MPRSDGGSAESARSAPVTIVVRPGAPVLTAPSTGTLQPGLTVAVAGSAAPGATVEIDADGASQATVTADAGGSFAASLQLANGSHTLTAVQALAGATSQASLPVLVTLGDVTPPSVVADEREIVALAADAQGTTVDFAAHVSATDNGAPLPASQITCAPASGSLFPLGSTNVSCQAFDAVGNRGATSFLVTVKSLGGPVISGVDVVAEAQGPAGAVVSYQVAATGFTTNCAAPGAAEVQACTAWKPASVGLGFVPNQLAVDPNDGPGGALYAGIADPYSPFSPLDASAACTLTLVKSPDHGATWQQIALPPLSVPGAACAVYQVLVTPSSPGTPATIDYISTLGMQVSRDGGGSWDQVLDGKVKRSQLSRAWDAVGPFAKSFLSEAQKSYPFVESRG